MENKDLSSEEKIKNEIKKLDLKAILIGFWGLIVLFLFPIFATKYSWLDFSNTGQIGDTIGGLTAPIIGIFSALLIYMSFRAQIKANYIVQSQIDKQREDEDEKREINYQMVIYSELKESILSFSYKNVQGPKAIKEYLIETRKGLDEGRNYVFSKFFHIFSVVSLFTSTTISLEQSKVKKFDIRMTQQLIDGLFYREIWSYLDSEIEEYLKKNSDESNFRELYESISKIQSYFEALRK